MKRKTVTRFIAEMQYRAEEIKSLEEQRADLVEQMTGLADTAETEKRALSEEESETFDGLETQVRALDETIKKIKKAKALGETQQSNPEPKEGEGNNSREEDEHRAFENYIRGIVEERADAKNLTQGDNGAVIPSSIANKIIKQVVDISPIFAKATRYNVKGNLSIPYYDETTQSITVAFAEEFKALTSTSGKYTSIQLKGYLAGALTKISKSLINNSQFDIVGEVIKSMAEKIAEFIENVLLNGATIGSDKIEGLTGITNKATAAAANKITMDELISLKDRVKDVYQKNACWIMHPETRTYLRTLKDANGRYLMQDDVTSEFGTTLLGKPVFVSDNSPKMEAGKDAVIYGDLSGLAVKVSEESNVQVLREKYADEHVDGVIAWLEFDSKVENQQKLAKLSMKEA
jgi:HK97 family phage major capsid protein